MEMNDPQREVIICFQSNKIIILELFYTFNQSRFNEMSTKDSYFDLN